MSSAVGGAGRADALRGEDHVDAAARAEVEHRLALVQVGDRGRVAAAERGERRRLGQLAALLGVVERLAELRRVALVARSSEPLPQPQPSLRRSPRAPTPRSGGAPPRAARQRSSSSAAHSFQVGDRGERLDRVALQREVGPLAALLALDAGRRRAASSGGGRRSAATARAARSGRRRRPARRRSSRAG